MDNYPPGAANDPNAPYNQVDPEPVDVEVCVSTTLSRSTTISVNDYIAEEWEDAERDEDGYINKTGGVDYDFSDSDLKGAYENQEYTIPELLEVLKEYVKSDMEGTAPTSGKGRDLKRILEACEGWNVDELEVIEE